MCFNPKPAFISDIYTNKIPYVNHKSKDGKSREILPNPNYNKLKRKIKFLNASEYEAYKKNPSYYSNQKEFIMIPCGKCLQCRISHANDWAVRCILESREYKNNCFVTLSYNPKNLPANATLVVKDLQDFMKRLRKDNKGLRYFACGEYGDKTLRPHYHIGFFNYKPTDLKFFKYNKCKDKLYLSKYLADKWGKGFIIVGDLTLASAGYIARYTQKKIYNNHDKIISELGRHKEFIVSSRRPGIGMNYFKNKKHFEEIKNNFGILIKENDKVQMKNIPRTFRNYWKEIDALDYFTSAEKSRQENKKIWKEKLDKIGINEIEYVKRQKELNYDRLKKLKRETF